MRSEPDGAASSSASSPVLPTNVDKSKCVVGNRKHFDDLHKYETSSSGSDDNVVNAPTTQILSEYKQPQREYKDYRGRFLITNECEQMVRQTTIHPQVTCNMPKVTRHQGMLHNLILKFNKNHAFFFLDSQHNTGSSRNVHCVKNSRQLGSTYLEEIQNHASNPSATIYQSYTPVTKYAFLKTVCISSLYYFFVFQILESCTKNVTALRLSVPI